MIKKKHIIFGIVIFVIFLLVGPMLINLLMFEQKSFKVSGDETLWVPALSTYFGALIGGLVSGLLTLIGVKLTLKGSFDGIDKTLQYQEKERTKETVGTKLNKLYKVKKIVYKLDRMLDHRKKGKNERYENDAPETIDKAIRDFIFPEFNNLLELAASVDWEFFEEINTFVDASRKLFYTFKPSDMDAVADLADTLTLTIEENHEKRLIEKFKKASN